MKTRIRIHPIIPLTILSWFAMFGIYKAVEAVVVALL